MAVNEDLVKTILEKLNEAYPNEVVKMEDIIPQYENQEELCLHLFHLRDLGCVTLIDFSSKDGKACGHIKLTPYGIDYLKSL